MRYSELMDSLERCPVIAAVREEQWERALSAPPELLFLLNASLLSIKQRCEEAHAAGKHVFVHLDLAEGIGRDKTGIRYLADCGVDGILSTKAQLIRWAKEQNLLAIQRFFVMDSQSMNSIADMVHSSEPHLMEIMPGVITKAVSRFAGGPIPVIAGGLVETKAEVTAALKAGAMAVSTGKKDLWEL